MSDPNDDFFVGYAETPPRERRFFLKAGLGLMAGTLATAGGVAALQNRPGPGTWAQGEVKDWTGIVTAEPYAMLRTLAFDGTPRTALLSCLGKCAVTEQLTALAGRPVRIRGSLIQRGPHRMIAVPELEPDWVSELDGETDPALAFPAPKVLTDIDLSGEILDSKCWFGAMRPSQGKVHKSCASLCIRGGIPPAFYARTPDRQQALMIMTTGGRAHGHDLLPLVADPVRIRGQVSRWGDLLMLDAPVSQIQRI